MRYCTAVLLLVASGCMAAGICPTITIDLHGCAVLKYHDRDGREQLVRVSHDDLDEFGRAMASRHVTDAGINQLP